MPTSSRSTPKRTRRHKRRATLWGFLFRVAFFLLLAVGMVITFYGIHLDKIVRAKFEGKRWALPARVYARPLELYVGRPLTREQLLGELERLGYRAGLNSNRNGSWQQDGERLQIRSREFRFWDGTEPARLFTLTLDNNLVADLADMDSGEPLALVRLDPALIASIYPTHNEDRVLLRREQLPNQLVKTLLAVEDRKFYQHQGIDPKGIARAAYQNLMAGRTVQGASTLTQQLVKNFFLTQERTLERKLNEAFMALLLDYHYEKNEILTAYANEVYMGQDGSRGIHGFGLASRFYFDRDLDELGIPETALLVGILKGPSEYNPRRNPDKVLKRRNLVIDLMAHHQIISASAAAAAKQQPLGLREGGAKPSSDYPAFISLVRRQLRRDYREEDLRSEGLRIFTTLDPLVQENTEQAVRERMPALDKKYGLPAGTLETAAVVTSVAQGEVLALVGGRKQGFAGFNRALDAVRPIGSLIKPVIYLTALSQPRRYSLLTPLADKPVSLRAGGQLWQPKNYDHRVHGNVPLYRALAKSYNLATVNLGLALGVDRVAQMLHDLGAVRKIDAVPAMLLGSVSLPPIEVAQVYQTIAAGGFRAPLRTIREVLNASGRPLNRYPLEIEPAVSDDAAYLTQWAMRRVVEQGTATWLNKRLPSALIVAGKTGTTNDMRDSWFAGFGGDKVVVVWIGRDDNQPTRLSGATGALRLWGDIMAQVDAQPLNQIPPDSVVVVSACGRSGVPFSRGYVGACGGGGGGGGERRRPVATRAQPAQPVPVIAQGELRSDPQPKPRTSEPAPKKRPVSPFMSDFYGN